MIGLFHKKDMFAVQKYEKNLNVSSFFCTFAPDFDSDGAQ